MSNAKQIKLEVDIEEAGTRLDVFVARLVPELSRSRVQQLNAFINGKAAKNSYKLKYGDEVYIEIPEARPLEMEAEDIPLDIKYEDENMLVVNKPAGMLTHPTSIEREHTLVNTLLFYCKDNLSGINGVLRPGIVHRLDRDTSGLLMIAKNDFAHAHLSEQIKAKTARRCYLAFVQGILKEDSGTVNQPINRHPTQKHKMAVVEGGKPSITHWQVLKRCKDMTYMEMSLETGRTHQIRVHFSYIHHPIIGDPLYGTKNQKCNLQGQALQAYKLSFKKPGSDETLTIEIEPDDDIEKLIRIH